MPALLASLFHQYGFPQLYTNITDSAFGFVYGKIFLVKIPVSNLVDAIRLLSLNKSNYVLVSVGHIFFTFM
jgi:hypothetical protein